MPLEIDDQAVVALARAFRTEHRDCCYPAAMDHECQIAAKRFIETLWDAGFQIASRRSAT